MAPADGLIAPGIVDTRSIVELQPSDVAGFTQVHFFAGIGGWSLAARLAGWPDTRPLWPEFHRLIAAVRPDVVMGEQVAAAVGKSWLDGVCADLESIGYACGAAVVPACAVDAPHRRDRLWFVADNAVSGERRRGICGSGESPRPLAQWSSSEFAGSRQGDAAVAHAHEQGLEGRTTLRERGDERSVGSHGVADADGECGQIDQDAGRRESGSCARPIAGPCSISNGTLPDAERSVCGHTGSTTPLGASSGMQGTDGEWQRVRPDAWPVRERRGFWHDSALAIGADGKARRVKPGIRLLAHGIPARVGKLRAFGNAIVPQVAAEIIGAYLDCQPD